LGRRLRYLVSFILFLTGNEIVFAQSFPELRFQHLSEKDGLSDNGVTGITQDKNGFIWFATINGLNRFEGYRVKQFFHVEGDSTSLPGNFVAQVVVDAKNNLWLSTNNGLAYFNTGTQKSINFIRDFKNSLSFRGIDNSCIYLDSANNAWVTTSKSLFRFDQNLQYNQLEEGVDSFNFRSVTIKSYNGILEDNNRQLWAYNVNRIFLLDPKSRKVVKTFESPFVMDIYRMFFDSNNRCWLVTRGSGLYRFIPESNQWIGVNLGTSTAGNGYIAEWKTNNKKYIVYKAENRNGLVLIDPESMHYRNYHDDALDDLILNGNGIGYIFVDNKNILWIGTHGGVSYVTPSSMLFDIIPIGVKEKVPDYSKKKVVFDLFDDGNGYWVSKWYTSGIFYYSKNWQLKKFLPALYPYRSTHTNFTSMACDMRMYKDKIYATTESGLIDLNPLSYRSKVFQPPDLKQPSIFRTIVPVSETIWWISSYYYGIFVFDVSKGHFIKHYQHNEGCINCLPDMINEMVRTRNGTIYANTYKGLYEYRPRTDDFISYRRDEKEAITFPSDSSYGMAEDAEGKLWINTNDGICIFNPFTKKVEKIFPDNKRLGVVNAICMDQFQNIWFTSAKGDWCFNPKTGQLINFSHEEGIPSNSIDGALTPGNDGYVYNGGLDAIARFYPERLQQYSFSLKNSVITEVVSNNKFTPVNRNEKNEKYITIRPGEHLFTVDFALVNYDAATGNSYHYRLLPVSNNWEQNNNGHLSFYDLNPGAYRLEVRGRNQFDGKFSTIDFLLITVNPYWWQSWWFKILCGVAIVFLITFQVRRRIKMIRKDAAYKQQQAGFNEKILETEMQALRAQMNPHFIFNSLNSIENFIMKNEKRLASDYLNKFALLMRMILDSSRAELVPFDKDIEALQLYIELEQLRFNNSFSYSSVIDPVLMNGDFRVPPLLIQPFVENAIIHGLSQSYRNDLQLLLTASLENENIVYVIQDNGIGRQKSEVYKTRNKPLYKSMGMSITQERISIFNHQQNANGKILITDLHDESGEPTGTKVQVKLKAI
jgi:ligand-binding sensor domain-containing protein